MSLIWWLAFADVASTFYRLHHRLVLLLYRRYNKLRRRWRNCKRRFCSTRPFKHFCEMHRTIHRWWIDLLKWLNAGAKRGRDNVWISNSHFVLWLITAWTLVLLAIHLINVNFPFVDVNGVLARLRARHEFFDLFSKYVLGALIVAIGAFMREIFNEVFRLAKDAVRATRLIKRWLAFYVFFRFIFCPIVRHPFTETPVVTEVWVTLLILQTAKWSIRKVRTEMGLPVGAVESPAEEAARIAKEKKSHKVLIKVLMYLLRPRRM